MGETWHDALVQRHIATATELVERAVGDFDACVLVGSLVAGYGTPRSDVDLLVLVERDPATTGGSPLSPGSSNTDRVDIETISLSRAHALLAELSTYDVHLDNTSQLYRVSDALELQGRLTAGPRSIRDSDGLRSLLELARSVAGTTRRLRVSRATLLANNTLEDTLGFLAIEDFRSALYSVNTLLQFAMDALCSALGDPYFGHKWNVQRLRKVLEGTSYLAHLVTVLDSPGVPTAPMIDRRIGLAQQMLVSANVTAWLPKSVPLTLPSGVARRNTLRRGDHWHFLKSADVWFMSDGARSFTVPWTAVLVWGLADGLLPDELGALARDEVAKYLDRSVPPQLGHSLVARLRDMGALHLDAPAPSVP